MLRLSIADKNVRVSARRLDLRRMAYWSLKTIPRARTLPRAGEADLRHLVTGTAREESTFSTRANRPRRPSLFPAKFVKLSGPQRQCDGTTVLHLTQATICPNPDRLKRDQEYVALVESKPLRHGSRSPRTCRSSSICSAFREYRRPITRLTLEFVQKNLLLCKETRRLPPKPLRRKTPI
jgi:hypothetical protein